MPDLPDLHLVAPDVALPVPPAHDRAAWDAADGPTVRDQVARATADLGSPWPQPLASTAARVHRDGDRAVHEALVFARQQRLSRAAAAAACTREARFLDAVADGLWLLAEQSSWCWPAHDDAHTRGLVLPDVDAPFLDLGAGEVVAQLAWVDHILGPDLDAAYPGLRARIRREARLRVFDPFGLRRDWHWLGTPDDVDNWNPWIHGNVIVGALRLLDAPGEEGLRREVVALAASGMDRYIASLPPDGATDEGYHYWWNGACRTLEAADILRHATDGGIDLLADTPALRATVGFPHRMQLGEGWVLNLADGQARDGTEVAWDALHRAARRIGDDDAAAFAASHRRPGMPVAREDAGLGRLLRALTDADWVRAEPAPPPLPGEVWVESIQVRIVRGSAGSPSGLTLAVKGGHNGEHHNHNDVGEVVVASGGVPVLVDPGRQTYAAGAFGPDRYRQWTTQSQWHGVPLIRGTAQSAGREHRAASVTPLTDGMALDLAAAYRVPGLRTWLRTARLVGGTVVIEDVWQLDQWHGEGPEPATLSCLVVAGEVMLGNGWARVLPLDDAPPVRLEWPGDIAATTTVQPLDDPMLDGVWGDRLTRIELDVTGRRRLTVTVRQDES